MKRDKPPSSDPISGRPQPRQSEILERERDSATLALLVGIVVVSNIVSNRVIPTSWYVLWNSLVAAAMVFIALRVDRLSLEDLGLGRANLKRGLRWGLVLAGAVLVAYLIGLAIPQTREFFRDDRASLTGWDVLYKMFVAVPFGTVLLEEVGFRGVVPAVFGHRMSRNWAIGWSSVLFGLWHILPAAHVNQTNAALRGSLGNDAGQVLAITLAVVATALVGVFFCWLRFRSQSLLTPIILHISTNSLAYLIAWVVLKRSH